MRALMDNRKQFLTLWATLLLIWLVANDSLARDVVVVGILVAGVLAWLFARFAAVYADINWLQKLSLLVFAYVSTG